jgi:hypothetical protein
VLPAADHEDRTVRPLEHVLGETSPENPFEPRTPLAAGDDQTRVDFAGELEYLFLRISFPVVRSNDNATEVLDPAHPLLQKPETTNFLLVEHGLVSLSQRTPRIGEIENRKYNVHYVQIRACASRKLDRSIFRQNRFVRTICSQQYPRREQAATPCQARTALPR